MNMSEFKNFTFQMSLCVSKSITNKIKLYYIPSSNLLIIRLSFYLPGMSWKRYPRLPVTLGIDRKSPLNECTLQVPFIWNHLYQNPWSVRSKWQHVIIINVSPEFMVKCTSGWQHVIIIIVSPEFMVKCSK